jgi:hypothetical protein
VNAKIEELDFEGSVNDWTILPDELVESGLSNFAGAVLSRVNAGVFAGSGAIQSHDKPHGLAVAGLRWGLFGHAIELLQAS